MEQKSRMERFFDGEGPGNSETEVWRDAELRYRKVMQPVTDRQIEEELRALVAEGANIDLAQDGGKTMLHYLSVLGKDRAMEILLEAGAYVNARDNDGNTPLHLACQGGARTGGVAVAESRCRSRGEKR